MPNSAATSSQAAAATNIGSDPGPKYMRPELISGGNSPKSNTPPLLSRPRSYYESWLSHWRPRQSAAFSRTRTQPPPSVPEVWQKPPCPASCAPVALTKRIGLQTQLRCGSTTTGLIVVSVTQPGGTDNVPIDLPRPKPAVNAARLTRPWFGANDINAASLLSRLRWVIAKPDGALSELSFDRDDVTDERGASNVVSGDDDSARIASGIVEITW